jgi:methionine synthase II (cobalamin-independent)
MIGRGALFLPELPVEIQPSGWRLTARAGQDLRRARDFLARDLDALEEIAGEHDGPVKVQLVGPWTLAAQLELPSGHRVVSDPGATRDLSESLAQGLAEHLAEVGRRLPRATVVVQLDEPSLPDVLWARLATASGYGTVRSVERVLVEQRLRDVLAVIPDGARVVHCCASDAPIRLMQDAGANALSLDLGLVRDIDLLGEAVDAGLALWLGVLPSTDAAITLDSALGPIRTLWKKLGFTAELLGAAVVPTPTCGLAGARPAYVRRALSVLNETGQALTELDG